MDEVSSILPIIKVNILIVNSSNDPVVLPKSSKEIFEKISSNIRYLEEIDSNEHVIVRGKSMKVVSEFIKKFLI